MKKISEKLEICLFLSYTSNIVDNFSFNKKNYLIKQLSKY